MYKIIIINFSSEKFYSLPNNTLLCTENENNK